MDDISKIFFIRPWPYSFEREETTMRTTVSISCFLIVLASRSNA
jgi:hypothetical protein